MQKWGRNSNNVRKQISYSISNQWTEESLNYLEQKEHTIFQQTEVMNSGLPQSKYGQN